MSEKYRSSFKINDDGTMIYRISPKLSLKGTYTYEDGTLLFKYYKNGIVGVISFSFSTTKDDRMKVTIELEDGLSMGYIISRTI